MIFRARRRPAALMIALGTALSWGPALTADSGPPQQAKQILAATGATGGLVVHLGCGDGKLTAALGAGQSYTVHGLDADPANVAKAQAHVESLGLYGRVTIDHWRGDRLPYVDNLVNLLVAGDGPRPSGDEMLRVLAPNGVAVTLDSRLSTLDFFRKPWPSEIDEWTHYLHDATNNAVARDTVVGPPRHYQWIGSPKWLRHHDHMSGFSAMVSTGGRIFYIIDLGPRWSIEMPPQWTLIARDAFNGTVLWQHPIPKWHAHLWPLKRGPAQLMRRLVALDDTVYVTPAVGAPVTAMDAATGEILREYEGTEGAEEMILSDGVLYVLVDPELDAFKTLPRDSVEAIRRSGRDWNWDERPRRLMAVEAATGNVLWSKTGRVAPTTLACAGGRLVLHDGDKVVCLETADGTQAWTSKPVPRWNPMHVLFGPTLVVYEDVVLFAGGENMNPTAGGKDTMTALSAATGEILWTAPHPPSGYASSEDLFVVDGLVWCGVTTNRRDSGGFTGRDPHTGEVKCEFLPDDWPHMPHHRCYRAKATSNYILTSRTGIEFVDFNTEHWTAHHWVRGSCNYGIMPSGGLIYAPPHSCACYPVAKLNSLNALAPQRGEGLGARDEKALPRLHRGPAYGAESSRLAPRDAASSRGARWLRDDWPTFRHDPARSGIASTSVPAELNTAWQARLGGKLSAPVVAGGRLFVTSIDTHDVHALDAGTGNRLWTFKAGGRVDSPPTIYSLVVPPSGGESGVKEGRPPEGGTTNSLCLFGSADGCVYCLRATDGAVIWRFRAAPADLRMTAYEQVESVWPVHGSVLVHDGVVHCVAGRAMWLDGGLRMLRLDVHSGRKLSETILDDKYPETGDNLQTDLKWPNLPVALPDVLSCDGRHVYMRSQPFDLEGNRTEVITPRDYRQQRGDTAHLFSPTGFLDDAWWHRSYWIYGRSFIGGAGGWHLASYQAPAGRILAVDDENVYGFGRVPMGFRGTPNMYHLFASSKEPELHNPNPNKPPQKRGASVYGPVIATRPEYHWSESVPLMVRALVVAGQTLFVAGPPEEASERDVYLRYGDPEIQAKMRRHVAAFEGLHGAVLMAASKTDGKKLAAYRLESAPVFDGMAAAGGRLFLSMLDGTVLCLAPGVGRPLEAAPDVEPGPAPNATAGFVETKAHPDFTALKNIGIAPCELGYRMQTAPREVGLALKELETPLTRRVELRVRVRPTPGASSPDKPGNGFLVFGDAPEDAELVKCGFRISGKRIYVVQGPLLAGKSKSAPVDVKADEIAELHVVVDLDTQQATVTMHGETLSAPLERRLDAVRWVGCSVTSVTTEFSPIEISGE